ncbi:Glycosyl transferase family 20 [Penicillium sp. DV-2018c]|nr:Glycosyl transferase family 20 [Penicillium sp. DV-2018c]KAJ5563432.1 Glycosyl transferase family 20 [Penicillium sp. DV-2018c]
MFESSVSSDGLTTSLSGLIKPSQFSWSGWQGIELNGEEDHIPRHANRPVCVGKPHVGSIDPEECTGTLRKPEERYKGIKVIVGVVRLYHIKGLAEELNRFDAFLDDHPKLQDKVVLIHITVPSLEDVKEHKELEAELCTLAGKINGKYAAPEGIPLPYMHRPVPFDELTALYPVADQDPHGVLIFSEFAGAASFMTNSSVLFRPANKTEISEALHSALNLDEDRHFTNANSKFEVLFLRGYYQPLTFSGLDGAKPWLNNSLLVANGQKALVDLRLLMWRLYSETQASELDSCPPCHGRPTGFESFES